MLTEYRSKEMLVQLSIYPFDKRSRDFFAEKKHALIGISPFNSYFNPKNIYILIQWVKKNFSSFQLFIPDGLWYYNFIAAGYSEKEAKSKTAKQDRYLKNKVITVLTLLGYSKQECEKLLVFYSDYKNTLAYQTVYHEFMAAYETNPVLRNGVINSCKEIMSANQSFNTETENFDIAVNYLLYEIPFIINTPKILNIESSVFLYQNTYEFIRHLFQTNGIVNEKQGYIQVSISYDNHDLSENSEENHFYKILDAVPGSIFWKDIEGKYQGANKYMVEMAGLKNRSHIIGKTDDMLPWCAISEELKKTDQLVMEEGINLQLEEIPTLESGKQRHFLASKSPLYEKKQVVGMIGVGIDISDLRKSQKNELLAIGETEKAVNTAKIEKETRNVITVLAGSIAHDLRVPLTSVMILADLFEKNAHKITDVINQNGQFSDILPLINTQLENFAKLAEKVRKAVLDMNNFISLTLKSLQRLITNTLSYEDFSVFEIEPCINDVIATFPFEESDNSIIAFKAIDNFSVFACPVLFYRVLYNLINNAVEQIREKKQGSIFICTESKGSINFLRIKDTAGGVSAEIISHLFDGFYTTKKEGTGVGLAFCKLTMKSFDGDIVCHLVEGDCIEFVLSFPALEQG